MNISLREEKRENVEIYRTKVIFRVNRERERESSFRYRTRFSICISGPTSCERDHERAINKKLDSSFNFGSRAYGNEARQEAAGLDNI